MADKKLCQWPVLKKNTVVTLPCSVTARYKLIYKNISVDVCATHFKKRTDEARARGTLRAGISSFEANIEETTNIASRATTSSSSTPPASTQAPQSPTSSASSQRVFHTVLDPDYADMFKAAVSRTIKQDSATTISPAQRAAIVSLQNLPSDDAEIARRNLKKTKQAIDGQKALEQMKAMSLDKIREVAQQMRDQQWPQRAQQPPRQQSPSQRAPPPPPPPPLPLQQPPLPLRQQSSLPPLPLRPQQQYIPVAAPPEPIMPLTEGVPRLVPVSANTGRIIPMESFRPQPSPVIATAPSSLVRDPSGVVYFDSNIEEPQAPPPVDQRLYGDALSIALQQNKQGVLGFFRLIEGVEVAMGMTAAAGTTNRLEKDPHFEQALAELLTAPSSEDGSGLLGNVFSMNKTDPPMLKIFKLGLAHMASNAANHLMAKMAFKVSRPMMRNLNEEARNLREPEGDDASEGSESQTPTAPPDPDPREPDTQPTMESAPIPTRGFTITTTPFIRRSAPVAMGTDELVKPLVDMDKKPTHDERDERDEDNSDPINEPLETD